MKVRRFVPVATVLVIFPFLLAYAGIMISTRLASFQSFDPAKRPPFSPGLAIVGGTIIDGTGRDPIAA